MRERKKKKKFYLQLRQIQKDLRFSLLYEKSFYFLLYRFGNYGFDYYKQNIFNTMTISIKSSVNA